MAFDIYVKNSNVLNILRILQQLLVTPPNFIILVLPTYPFVR